MSSVPGFSKEVSAEKKKNEYISDFESLTQPQLLELLDRQNKLINSRALLYLKDKGEKVKLLKKQIEEELEKRKRDSDDICNELNKLSITEKTVELIEWGDKANGCEEKESSEETLEDEKNPFILLATHSGTIQNKKVVKVEELEEPLVTLADIEEAYALSLCNRIDKTVPKKERFLPHKSLKSTSDSSKAKVRDLSAATPPLPVFGDTKLITLEESLKLQYEQTKHLKEVQLRHATERLRDSRIRMGNILPIGDCMTTYREHNSPLESEEETNDENNPEE